MGPPILEVEDLVKKYNRITAVDGVSFSLEPGVCFGLLGPNGAGKTTTIEVIEDIIPPTSGRIRYMGKPRSRSFHEEIGIQFQSTSLLGFLTVRETLKTFQSLYTRTEPVEGLIRRCRLEDFQHQYNDRISGGQRQRFLLALALINRPRLLFLDEPSTGLDPQARHNLWDLIRQIKEEGRTLVLTTHYMEEAQALCDEVAIMDAGMIIARGSPDELIRRHAPASTVIVRGAPASTAFERIPFDMQRTGEGIEIQTEDVNACLAALMSLGLDLSSISVRSPSLETVFLNLTGKQLRE